MRRRFHTLDGMRGIAALMILFLHTPDFAGPLKRPLAYLGVDLFFVISGVVLAEAYGKRLKEGLSPAAFLRLRLVRLYPLYLLGTLVALVPVLMVLRGWGENAYHWTASSVALSLTLGLAMLPDLTQAALYPFLPSAWSLLYEVVANIVWAGLGGDRWKDRALNVAVLLSALALVAAALSVGDLDLGRDGNATAVLVALCRVAFSFSAGLWIHRHAAKLRLKAPAWAVLAATLALLSSVPGAGAGLGYGLLSILVVFPLLVALALSAEPTSAALRAFCDAVGRASYGVYTLHLGAYLLVRGLLRKAIHVDLAPWAPWTGLAFAAGLTLLVLWLDRVYDEPLRHRWSGRA